MDEFTIEFVQGSRRGVAQISRPADDQVEHGLRIARRGRHRLEHVDRGGLMFDALAEFAVARGQFGGALLEFAEQPRVLQRDHRLVGECADKLYLPVGKRLDPLAREEDGADRPALAHKGHAERGPHLSESDGQLRITWNGDHVTGLPSSIARSGVSGRVGPSGNVPTATTAASYSAGNPKFNAN